MGYQDREYYQEDRSSGGYQLGGDLSYTWRIVIVNAAVFVTNLFLFGGANLIVEYGALHGDTLVKPWFWYQFLTYGFVHSPGDIGHVFWNMFGLVIFGSSVEETYGRREYLRFYLVSILCGGLFWGTRVYLAHQFGWDTFSSDPKYIPLLLGASGAVTAVTLLFCLRNPFATIRLMFVLPVPAWVLGTLIIIGNVFQASQAVNTVAYDVHLVGAAFAVAYFYFDWNLTRVLDFSWLSRAGSSVGKLLKPRPKLKVYDEEGDDDAVHRQLESEADRILAKISRDGEGSLSAQERKTLEHYSRLMRQKHR